MTRPDGPREGIGRAPLLTERRPIPPIGSEQLSVVTRESLHVVHAGLFNPAEARATLANNEGRQVIGIDLGGGKATAIFFRVRDGRLVADPNSQETVLNTNGKASGYLPFLKETRRKAQEGNILVGVSSAGRVEGTRLIETPNMPDFQNGLRKNYGGDFAKLFPTVGAVNNDAQAAIKPAILHAVEQGVLPAVTGEILAMEPGHVRLVDLQSSLGRPTPDKPCGMFEQTFVCVEQVVGGAAGIEALWEKSTGKRLDGRKISERYQQGNPLATSLYDTSAEVLATVIQGMGTTLELTGDQPRAGLILPIIGGGFGGAAFVTDVQQPEGQQALSVAFHGGVNNVPGYMDRVVQILGEAGTPVTPSFTEAIAGSKNAGLEGAALAALVAEDRQAA